VRQQVPLRHEEDDATAFLEPRAQPSQRLDEALSWHVLQHGRRHDEVVVAPRRRQRIELEHIRLRQLHAADAAPFQGLSQVLQHGRGQIEGVEGTERGPASHGCVVDGERQRAGPASRLQDA
jgi:hypothetical protein